MLSKIMYIFMRFGIVSFYGCYTIIKSLAFGLKINNMMRTNIEKERVRHVHTQSASLYDCLVLPD